MIPGELLLIVGLGNPGINYHATRHNLGATWVKKACFSYNITLKSNMKLISQIAYIKPSIIFIIPDDYINNSGFSVKKTADYYKIDTKNILVIHDDLDLPVGTIRLKKFGGHSGHNGLKHIIEQLKTNDFYRLRIGIGRPETKEEVINYVLNKASNHEQSIIDLAIDNSLKIIPELLNIKDINWVKVNKILNCSGENRNGI